MLRCIDSYVYTRIYTNEIIVMFRKTVKRLNLFNLFIQHPVEISYITHEMNFQY